MKHNVEIYEFSDIQILREITYIELLEFGLMVTLASMILLKLSLVM